jgi:23S rRNA (guanosine2251-2'-O)-methyltransferase
MRKRRLGKPGPSGRAVEPRAKLPAPGALIMGRNCLREVLKWAPERLIQVFAVGAGGNKVQGDFGRLLDSLQEQGVEVSWVREEELSSLLNSASHQGVAAAVRPRVGPDWRDFVEQSAGTEQSLVLALDEVNDPHNLGALLRTAECFSVNAVIWSKNRSASVSPVVTKASAGASELVNYFEVPNLAQALRGLKAQGFWIVAADTGHDAVSLREFEFPDKCALVMGSEGEGIGRLIMSLADYHVCIPLSGRVTSLNVSQAAAVLLYGYRNRVGGK